MATVHPTLIEPDKLGILVQCRKNMDKLKINNFKSFLSSSIEILSINQWKRILFIGLNQIKEEVTYNQLFQMKSTINKIIENEKKKKQKSKTKISIKKPVIPSIPQNASLSEIIPFDILSSNICPYLTMSSITKLARCDRKLSIICHTPISITNLMHRHDGYTYFQQQIAVIIDGKYKWNDLNMHRMKNIERLSIKIGDLTDSQNMDRFNNTFSKIKYLSFYDYLCDTDCSYNINVDNMKLLPLLQTISFSDFEDFPFILSLFEKYKQISNKLKSISLINCQFAKIENYQVFDEIQLKKMYKEYKNMVNVLLPTKPNNLEILKLENSYFDESTHPQCSDINDKLKNAKIIKSSLSNLKGFVYSSPSTDFNLNYQHNLFWDISTNILTHFQNFNQLQSIHLHCLDENESLLSNHNNISTSSQITELCMSLALNENGKTELTQNINNMSNLNKLCLVIDVTNNDNAVLLEFGSLLQSTLSNLNKLKLLQIVIIINDDESHPNLDNDYDGCTKSMHIVSKFGEKLIESLQTLTNSTFRKQALMFKFHVKSCHYYFKPKCKIKNDGDGDGDGDDKLNKLRNMIQNMIKNYLLTFPRGQIQCKFTWNIEDNSVITTKMALPLKGLDGICDVDIISNGSLDHLKLYDGDTDKYADCCNDKDYKQYVISARKKNINNIDDIQYDKQWLVDCQYCCNTPWI